MPSNESYRSYLDTPSERWKAVPKAVRNLYRDERAFQLYQAFKAQYGGEPHRMGNPPKLTRERGGRTIHYDMPVLSAITTNGNHLVHIAAGQAEGQIGLDAKLQFFVATLEFDNGETTEWWVSDVRGNRVGEPAKLELFLSPQPVYEVPDYIQPYHQTEHPFDELDRIDDAHQSRLEAEARAIKYVYENQRSYLSWGDGKAPSTFRSFSEVEADLYTLHQAESAGMLGSEPIGHQFVIEHLQRAA